MQLLEVARKFAEGVGEAVGKVDLLLLLGEGVRELQVVVVTDTSWVSTRSANVPPPAVGNLFTAPHPAIVLALLGDAHSHAVAVETRWLCEVTNIEGYLSVLVCLKMLN